jgi:hypothetical protein
LRLALLLSAPALSSSSTISSWPPKEAAWRAVVPPGVSAVFMSAPARKSTSTIFAWPLRLAMYRGVEPRTSRLFLSAPAASSSSTTSLWPLWLATYRGVRPLSSHQFLSAPAARNIRAAVPSPLSLAVKLVRALASVHFCEGIFDSRFEHHEGHERGGVSLTLLPRRPSFFTRTGLASAAALKKTPSSAKSSL